MACNYLVLSASLRPSSRSKILASHALQKLQEKGADVEFLDLQDHPLPFCDGGACYGDARLHAIKGKLEQADGYLIATPIYNYDMNSALKNLIELTGRDVWTEKVVGFLCAAGGKGSYMAIMNIAGDLMLDFRTLIVPRFVYVTGEDFEEDEISNGEIVERIDQVSGELIRLTEAVRGG